MSKNKAYTGRKLVRRITAVSIFILGLAISLILFFAVIEIALHAPPIDFSEELEIISKRVEKSNSLFEIIGVKADFYFAVADHIWLSWGILTSGLLLTAVVVLLTGKSGESGDKSRNHTYLQQERRQRKALEKRLENTDSKVLDSHENISDAFMLVGSDMQLIHANGVALDFFETWVEDIQQPEGHNLKDLIPDFQFSGFRKHLSECLEIDDAWEGEIKIGDEFLLIRIFPARTGVFVNFRDISHQKHSTSMLEVGQILLKQVSRNVHEPLAIVDLDWKYLVSSLEWRECFGLVHYKRLEGLSHLELLPDIPGNINALTNRIKQGKTLRTENVTHKINGKEEHVNWEIRPWKNQYGKISGCILQANFVTDDVQQQQRDKQEMRKEKMLAYHDMLTGLPNRQLFYDRLNVALAQAYRNLTQISLMFLDLDGFKAVNDTLGHDVGDILLKEVSARLKQCVRETDTVARLGGDEFTIVLTDVNNADNVAEVADKILKSVAEPFHISGNEVKIGTSIGISLYPSDGSTTTELVKTADTAMYRAKESGKNCYFFYEVPDDNPY
jgi:diguanylate cyclase (GGDEF)-like protein